MALRNSLYVQYHSLSDVMPCGLLYGYTGSFFLRFEDGRWKQYVSPKRWWQLSKLHRGTSRDFDTRPSVLSHSSPCHRLFLSKMCKQILCVGGSLSLVFEQASVTKTPWTFQLFSECDARFLQNLDIPTSSVYRTHDILESLVPWRAKLFWIQNHGTLLYVLRVQLHVQETVVSRYYKRSRGEY